MLNYEELIQEAVKARNFAYAPYSNFHVGAALLTKSGTVYTGCNIENAAYTPTNCAERTAFFKAISQGERDFQAIAIIGEKNDYLAPCGVCRQVMMEFVDPVSFYIILARNEKDYQVMTLDELFPYAFGKENL
ncbi:MAG: cytidine deaminase [Lachnospiraceae bacterium]